MGRRLHRTAEDAVAGLRPSPRGPVARDHPLLALQRSAGNRAVAQLLAGRGAPVVQRGPVTDAVTKETGVTVEQRPDAGPDLSGRRYALPAAIRLEKRPATGRGRWLTAPSFQLHMDPRKLVGGLLDQVTVGGLVLTNPTLSYSTGSSSLFAAGTVSIPTPYPPEFDTPLDVGVRIRSTGLRRFDVQGGVGPFVADLTLTVDYDSEPLKRLLAAAQAGNLAGVTAAAGGLDREGSFRVSGTAGVGGPGAKVPLTYGRGSGEITKEGVRARGGAGGVIGLPAGTFHPELAAPAAGVALGAGSVKRQGGADVVSGFGGVTGTPDIQKLLTGDLAGGFVPFAYAQVTAMRRTKDGHEFTLRISGQLQLGDEGGGRGGLEQLREAVDAEGRGTRYAPGKRTDSWRDNIDPAVTAHRAGLTGGPGSSSGVSVTLTGTFDLFGSK